MIHTIIIVTCTVINCVWGFFWIRQLDKQYEIRIRSQHFELCSSSIRNNVCPHDCQVCAWGETMTQLQIDQKNRIKRTKKFYKEIKEYHRRHKHDS